MQVGTTTLLVPFADIPLSTASSLQKLKHGLIPQSTDFYGNAIHVEYTK